MSMSKKDYEAIARAFNGQRIIGMGGSPSECPREFLRGANEQTENYVSAIADYCAADNPRFDRHRFLIACGVSSANDNTTAS